MRIEMSELFFFNLRIQNDPYTTGPLNVKSQVQRTMTPIEQSHGDIER